MHHFVIVKPSKIVHKGILRRNWNRRQKKKRDSSEDWPILQLVNVYSNSIFSFSISLYLDKFISKLFNYSVTPVKFHYVLLTSSRDKSSNSALNRYWCFAGKRWEKSPFTEENYFTLPALAIFFLWFLQNGCVKFAGS